MPCLNEERTLEACIRKAQQCFRELGIDGEVVIADNGSTDASVALAESLGARVVHQSVRGYGAALMKGIEKPGAKSSSSPTQTILTTGLPWARSSPAFAKVTTSSWAIALPEASSPGDAAAAPISWQPGSVPAGAAHPSRTHR